MLTPRKRWLRRLSLIGVVALPSFVATCASGTGSLRINAMTAPVTAPLGSGAGMEIRAA